MNTYQLDALRKELGQVSAREESPRGGIFVYACLALVVALAVWAHFSKITEITRGQGTVVPSGKQQSIQSLEGGMIDRVLVKEGQVVEAGEVLILLNETKFKTAYEEASTQFKALSASVARLEAEVSEAKSISFSETDGIPAAVMQAERKLFSARRARLDAALRAVSAELRANRQQMEVVNGLIIRRSAGKLEAVKLRSQRAELQGRLADLKNTYIQDAYAELSLKRSELLSLQQIMAQRRDQLTRTKLVSPVRGVVNDIVVTTRGAVATPGEEIMKITPLDGGLVFETRVRPEDIAFLAPGMPASIRISAYDYTKYGILSGHVDHISADTLTEVTPRGEERYYKVSVSSEIAHLQYQGEKLQIKPGMIAQVDIQTGERSVLQYLLRPLRFLELR